MKLAAIDIGTNSIHMIVVEAVSQTSFNIIEREKEMVKLGVGVFSSNYISDRAFEFGLETITRYVKLVDRLGVDEIITAATSAIREARNGEDFLSQVVTQTGLRPRIISGKEEAKLIFLAVRNSIALEADKTLVIDIGGGSTETVVGNSTDIFWQDSMPLGVLRLLDMFPDKGTVGTEGKNVLEAHIRFVAKETFTQIHNLGFQRVIGTSGTIRTMGEAAHIAAGGESLNSVNAEVVRLKDIDKLTEKLLEMKLKERAEVEGVSEKRADAIHLGGVLLTQLLNMAEVEKITLCDASLREGMILDYLARHSQELISFNELKNLRHRKAAQLVHKYESDWSENRHIADLALQIFDQTQEQHQYGNFEREILEFAALVHNIGQFISYKKHHKNSRFLIDRTKPKGFKDEEILLIKHLVRYHCKAKPTKKHKKFRKLDKHYQRTIQLLSGILRIAVALNKTRNQQVKQIVCQMSSENLEIRVASANDLEVEIWAARRERRVLAKALGCEIKINMATSKV